MIKSKKLEIDEHGLNILYYGIRKEHIEFSQITKAEIKKEFYQKNWIVTLIIGIIVTAIAVGLIIENFKVFEFPIENTRHTKGAILYIISHLSIFLLGTGIIFAAFRRSLILFIWVKGTVKRIQLLDMEKKNIEDLYDFLNERIKIDGLHVL